MILVGSLVEGFGQVQSPALRPKPQTLVIVIARAHPPRLRGAYQQACAWVPFRRPLRACARTYECSGPHLSQHSQQNALYKYMHSWGGACPKTVEPQARVHKICFGRCGPKPCPREPSSYMYIYIYISSSLRRTHLRLLLDRRMVKLDWAAGCHAIG